MSIKVRSRNGLSHMLLVCIGFNLKSVMKCKLLILFTYHSDILCLPEQECEDPWLFFEAKKGPGAKTFVNNCIRILSVQKKRVVGVRRFILPYYWTSQALA
jgi:hypothetical protein